MSRTPRVIARLACLMALLPSQAWATDFLPGVSLEWVRGPGAEQCISGPELRTEVRRRVATDPFRPPYAISLEGFVRREPGTWVATLYLRHAGETTAPTVRNFASPTKDCESLGAAITLATALLIDPHAKLTVDDSPAAASPAPPAPPPAAPLPEESPVAPPVATPSGPIPPATSSSVVLSGRLDGGALARTTGGIGIGLEVSAMPFSGRGGLIHLPERELVTGSGTLGLGLTAFSLGGCAGMPAMSWLLVRGCADLLAGEIYAVVFSGIPLDPGARLWSAVSVSAEAVAALRDDLGIVVSGGVWAPLTRHAFRVAGAETLLFQQPVLIPGGAIGVRLHLP